MEEVKRRLIREGINISVFAEENVDLNTFLALTREDFIDLNFSVIKTRKILMIQEEIRSRKAMQTLHRQPPPKIINKTNNNNNVPNSHSNSLTEVVQNTIMTPVTVNDTSANYSIVTIPTMGGTTTTNYNDNQMMNAVKHDNEIECSIANMNANNDTNSSHGDMIQVSLHGHQEYNSHVTNEIQQQNQDVISLTNRLSEAFPLVENLDFRSLLAQDDEGALILEVLDRGDYLNKRLPNRLVRVLSLLADDFIFRNFGIRYPYEIGAAVKEWFGLRKGNNRTGRIHSRNEKRK
ncbi:hypothetical protein BLA29_001395 [Euroglyphus maynei]|uniref:SAM domain-containing protein n=1 Tax=Euroglyphus maynei TaxID=6958 RepID=A0A1Y3BI79_EURMA|nr:hypothetical protein BLA29_001395 [Euroglyphus maynei]